MKSSFLLSVLLSLGTLAHAQVTYRGQISSAAAGEAVVTVTGGGIAGTTAVVTSTVVTLMGTDRYSVYSHNVPTSTGSSGMCISSPTSTTWWVPLDPGKPPVNGMAGMCASCECHLPPNVVATGGCILTLTGPKSARCDGCAGYCIMVISNCPGDGSSYVLVTADHLTYNGVNY